MICTSVLASLIAKQKAGSQKMLESMDYIAIA
jgi:hypothetical protein